MPGHVPQETGLLDIGLLDGAPDLLRDMATSARARPPLQFQIFFQTAKTDWWLLLLAGAGDFGVPASTHEVAPTGPVLERARGLGGFGVSSGLGSPLVRCAVRSAPQGEATAPP